MKELTFAAFSVLPGPGLEEKDFSALPDPEPKTVQVQYTAPVLQQCVGANCTTNYQYAAPVGGGWYLGKNLRRR